MNHSLKLSLLEKINKTPNPEVCEDEQLLSDIQEVCQKIQSAYSRFEFEADDDLLDAAIYEIEALKSRYRYLIKLAKENKISNRKIASIQL